VLGRDDIGSLEAGKCADLVAFDVGGLDHAGALHDPLAALLFATPGKVALAVINGRVVAREGRMLTVDEGRLVERHNRLARELIDGA
jgi:cytosine/adenosine deaminase-related metal-dependent hydrolase